MKKKILITAKTYPSLSKKYEETVCTAGIELGEEQRPAAWVRIYPIPFRYEDNSKKFKLYSVIEAEVEKDLNDSRLESYKIINDQYEVTGGPLDTKKNWEKRKQVLFPLLQKSLEEIKTNNQSIGVIKPREIISIFHQEGEKDWSDSQSYGLAQQNLFKKKKPLDKVPFRFYYQFKCNDESCKGHKLSVIDWGTLELYRKMYAEAPPGSDKEKYAIKKVIYKLEYFSKETDLHFIVGNQKLHRNSFMIIGLFYPKKED